jgi:hypothetical protein
LLCITTHLFICPLLPGLQLLYQTLNSLTALEALNLLRPGGSRIYCLPGLLRVVSCLAAAAEQAVLATVLQKLTVCCLGCLHLLQPLGHALLRHGVQYVCFEVRYKKIPHACCAEVFLRFVAGKQATLLH